MCIRFCLLHDISSSHIILCGWNLRKSDVITDIRIMFYSEVITFCTEKELFYLPWWRQECLVSDSNVGVNNIASQLRPIKNDCMFCIIDIKEYIMELCVFCYSLLRPPQGSVKLIFTKTKKSFCHWGDDIIHLLECIEVVCLRSLYGDLVSWRGALPVETLLIGQHTSYLTTQM